MAYDFPANPNPGDEYTPPVGGQVYIYQPPRWLVKGIPPAGGGGGGGIAEAPVDGKQYGRTSAAWTEVLHPTWTTLTGKPATFPPTLPIAQSDVTNLITDQATQDTATAAKVAKAGDTMTGKLNTMVPTAASAGLNIGSTGVSPTTPVNGDIWITTSGNFRMQMNGVQYVGANLEQAQTFSGIKTFTGQTIQGNSWFGTGTDGSSAGSGIILMKRASGYNESIAFSDGAGGLRGGISMLPAGMMAFRVGDNTTDDVFISTTGLITSGGLTASGVITANGNLKINAADGVLGFLQAGATKVLRFVANSIGFSIEGVDNTGVGSYQPLTLKGSTLTFSGPITAQTADFTGAVTTPTPTAGDSSTKVATTAFVTNAVSASVVQPAAAVPLADGIATVGTATKYAREDHKHPTDTTLAPLASPIFTGNPQAPTPTPSDNDTSIATTAFVTSAVAAVPSGASISDTPPSTPGAASSGGRATAARCICGTTTAIPSNGCRPTLLLLIPAVCQKLAMS